jgi:nitrite reductase/ring-hydroxylating ferredoxin subunit
LKVRVGSVSALPPGTVAESQVGDMLYALCHHRGEITVFDASCPCTGGPLGQGTIRENLLVCPWHGMRFDTRNGQCPYDPKLTLTQFPVEIRGDDILIETE